MTKKRQCGFEQREQSPGYWNDPRWKEVQRLRREDRQSEANHLTFQIRDSWGVD